MMLCVFETRKHSSTKSDTRHTLLTQVNQSLYHKETNKGPSKLNVVSDKCVRGALNSVAAVIADLRVEQ